MSQVQKKVAYQGVPGAFSNMASLAALPDHAPTPCATFEDMLAAVRDGDADLAMVPVENSVAGRVADIHHLLPNSGLHIVGEHFHRVEMCLLALPGTKIDEIEEVRSHGMALAQCRGIISKHGFSRQAVTDTAGAAKDVAEEGNREVAAIASKLSAEIYGLEVLAENIEDAEHNTTRFLIMAREPRRPVYDPAQAYLTTVVFEVRSVPAALYKAMGGFATNGVNLTKLESYLVGGHFSAAQFYTDAEAHLDDPRMQNAMEELRYFSKKDRLKVLGVYPAGEYRKVLESMEAE
ncbi:MAG: prephenate dehydratase [Alphaproteobacteria bacterium]|nr:prephenate dehydratase [Alphaproteobacteria bacterium]